MPRNGSGTYSLPAGNPVVTGTSISSSGWANPTLADIAGALTASLAVDGQTVPTANLPMGNFRHTNVANAQNRNEYATLGQVQDGGAITLSGVSGTDTITASVSPSATLAAGQVYRGVAAGANTTTAVTLNINGAGAKSVTKFGSNALAVGDIQSAFLLYYDGTRFQLLNPNTFNLSANSVSITGANGILLANQTSPNVSPIRFGDGSGWKLSFQTTGGTTLATLKDNGDFTATGNITANSDERLKTGWELLPADFIERLATVKSGTYERVDIEGPRHAGVSAQSLRDVLPEAVLEGSQGLLSVAYGNAALVACVELAKEVMRLRAFVGPK